MAVCRGENGEGLFRSAVLDDDADIAPGQAFDDVIVEMDAEGAVRLEVVREEVVLVQ